MTMPVRYTLVDQTKRLPAYEVIGHFADGSARPVGRIVNRWIRHLQCRGWVATNSQGDHRSVHGEAWEAAWACGWDGRGMYPFPVSPAHRSLVRLRYGSP